jgi:hypothetical protein
MRYKLIFIWSFILLWITFTADTCEQPESKFYYSANRNYTFWIDGMHGSGRCLGRLNKNTFFASTIVWKKYLTENGQPLISAIPNSGAYVVSFYQCCNIFDIDVVAEYPDTGLVIGRYSLKNVLDSSQVVRGFTVQIESLKRPKPWFELGDSVVAIRRISRDSLFVDTVRIRILK